MKKSLIIIVSGFMLLSFATNGQKKVNEYELKAAFIYKFTNYIEWEAPIGGDEFIIGIVGSSPIKNVLASLARTKMVKDKNVVIRQFNKLEEVSFCHILFISQKAPFPLENILDKADQKGTLMIGEKAGYAAQGTEINFILTDKNLKFEANTQALSAAGLKVSSQLLKLAVIVK